MISRVAVLIAVLLLGACAKEDVPGAAVSAAGDGVTVTGIVTLKDDQVPADGGVTLTLKLDAGGTETLVFGSLFTHPPPSPERHALYQVLVGVNVGDHVSATGRRSEGGILLEKLVKLEPR